MTWRACRQAVADIDFESEIQLEEKIGSGAFGSVYRGALLVTPMSSEKEDTHALFKPTGKLVHSTPSAYAQYVSKQSGYA